MQENNNMEGTGAQAKKKFGETVKGLAGTVGEKAGNVAKKSTEMVDKSKEAVFQAIDVNGDGQIDISFHWRCQNNLFYCFLWILCNQFFT